MTRQAEQGKVWVRKADSFVMGKGIDLGKNDTFDNYYQREVTEEEKPIYYPEKPKKERKNTKKAE